MNRSAAAALRSVGFAAKPVSDVPRFETTHEALILMASSDAWQNRL